MCQKNSTLLCALIISTSQVMAQMGLCTAGFVMLTLSVNVPKNSTLLCAVIISTSQVMAQMGLWTAGFVMLTLLVNGPLISPLIRWLGLSKVSAAKKQVCM